MNPTSDASTPWWIESRPSDGPTVRSSIVVSDAGSQREADVRLTDLPFLHARVLQIRSGHRNRFANGVELHTSGAAQLVLPRARKHIDFVLHVCCDGVQSALHIGTGIAFDEPELQLRSGLDD